MVCAEINAVEILKYPGRFLSTQTRQPFRIDGVCGGHIRWNYQVGSGGGVIGDHKRRDGD